MKRNRTKVYVLSIIVSGILFGGSLCFPESIIGKVLVCLGGGILLGVVYDFVREAYTNSNVDAMTKRKTRKSIMGVGILFVLLGIILPTSMFGKLLFSLGCAISVTCTYISCGEIFLQDKDDKDETDN